MESTSAAGSCPATRSMTCIPEHSQSDAAVLGSASHGHPCGPAAVGLWAAAAQRALAGQGQVQQGLLRAVQLAQAGLELEAGQTRKPC